MRVANGDEDQERQGEEVEEGGDVCRVAPVGGSGSHDDGGDACRDSSAAGQGEEPGEESEAQAREAEGRPKRR